MGILEIIACVTIAAVLIDLITEVFFRSPE